MDAKIIPLMAALSVLLIAGMGYVFYTSWRSLQRIAWNVVNAVLVLKDASPDLVREIDSAVEAVLPELGMTPDSLQRLAPAVRYAVYSIAMQRGGIQPPNALKPFYPLSSPYIARAAKNQIRMVRYDVESEQKVRLTELDQVSDLAAENPGRTG